MGQSYGIIRYYESAPITTPATNTQSSDASAETTASVPPQPTLPGSGDPGRKNEQSPSTALKLLLPVIIISTALILIVVLSIVGFLFILSRSRARRRGIRKSDEEQASLVIKVDHEQHYSKDVKEKETLMDENNSSPVQAQLDQKLPDVIRSRRTL